jgi:hypothetical protein
MKVKSPAEIIKALRIDFTRVWEYEPPFEILTEEIEYEIDQINKRALLLYRERERITEPERKQLYTDMINEEGDKLGAYLNALDLVRSGRYE